MIDKKLDCCVCGRNLMTLDNKLGGAMVITIGDDAVSHEIYPELKHNETYVVCYACVLRGMRVRV